MSGDLPDELFRPRTPAVGGSTMPVVTSAKAASSLPGHRQYPTPRSGGAGPLSRGPSGLLSLLAVALAALVGLAGGLLIHRAGAQQPSASAPASAATSSAVPSQDPELMPWQGPVQDIAVTSVDASCVAPEGVDPSGESISFRPDQAVDGHADTAWRCNGNGVGQRLLFTVPANTMLAGVSLVNGWTRNEGRATLYDQFRRITSVRWDLPDGSWFVQNLSDNDRGAQSLMIPPTRIAGTIRMTILSSTKPGRPDQQNRDAVLLSEVTLLAPQ